MVKINIIIKHQCNIESLWFNMP